ncbi:MAG: hypothetical protein L6Q76_01565 [Polyangiaceae bacterium]|nr:hypothetical protein [Polyangiaceae bacterium]
MRRRGFLIDAFGALGAIALAAPLGGLAGCASHADPPPRPKPPLPPLKVGPLDELIALAGLRWVLLVKPRAIASIAWLIPSIGKIVPEENFARFAARTGLDLRSLPEAAVATYDTGDMLYLARHAGDPAAVEGWFRSRLTSDERRSMDRPDLIRLTGKIGLTPHALALLGRTAVAYQHGGSLTKGPARVAALFAQGKLKRSPSVLSAEPLRSLAARFGDAPLRAFARGPFEGELARGARGLLAGATAIGAAARPTAREKIGISIAVAGDFTTSAEPAAEELLTAWNDLANGSFGHLLGLDRPIQAPLATHTEGAVAVAVELDPQTIASGLAAATGPTIDEILR